MQPITILSEYKATEAERRQAAADSLIPVLADYARTHHGRFLMYGSAARGQMEFDSDVDLLLDFPVDALGDAWTFTEAACWVRGLRPDLLPYSGCKPDFLLQIEADLRVLV